MCLCNKLLLGCNSKQSTNNPNVCSASATYPGTCNCKASYYWNTSQDSCIKIVNPILNQTQINNCNFQTNFIYDYNLYACVRKCTLIPMATTVNLCDTTQCNRQVGFYWDSITNKCAANCSQIAYATLQNSNNVSSCYCVTGFMWSTTYSKCVRNCALISYTTGLNINDTTKCTCASRFQWSTSTIKYVCANGYVWSSFWSKCVVKLYSANPNDNIPENSNEAIKQNSSENINQSHKLSTNDILAIALSTILGSAAILAAIILVIKCRKNKSKANDESDKQSNKPETQKQIITVHAATSENRINLD